MISRPILTALAATALYAVILVSTASSAETHAVRVTFASGKVATYRIQVGNGETITAAMLPGVTEEVRALEDLGQLPLPTITPIPTVQLPELPIPTAVPTVVPTAVPTIIPTPTVPSGGGDGGGGGGGSTGGGGTTNPLPQTPVTGKPTPVPTSTPGATDSDPGNTESVRGRVKKKVKKVAKQLPAAPPVKTPGRNVDGTPTIDNPTYSLALPGPAPIGVPNFFIDKFRIPPFLLPIYQAAGIEYGIRWEILAAINEIETDYGRNLNISSAGAVGWMQFMPATWKMYGVDANKDGEKDPFNPVDAIFAAARYLKAAGGDTDVRRAIFAYNHADWYVDSVLLRAQVIGGLPSSLVGSLTGLTQGRFPVHAKATYADDISERDLKRNKARNKAVVVESGTQRRGIKVFSRDKAPVIAVNDGRIVDIGTSKRLGNFIKLQDVYGNTYTYGHLKSVARRYPAPKKRTASKREIQKELALPKKDAAPTQAASSTSAPAARRATKANAEKPAKRVRKANAEEKPAATAKAGKQRLFANPRRPRSAEAGGAEQEFQRTGRIDGVATFRSYLSRVYGLDRQDVRLKRLKVGSTVVAGTILGRLGRTEQHAAPHVLFEIRPAGRGAPRIDPKPILDGWKLLESTAIYRAAGKNPFFGSGADAPSIGQILLMSKEALAQRVVNNPRIKIYDCGRQDVQTGQIDRRVLATLEFLAASGFKPTVTSLKCGHGLMTASGNVSEHSTGSAVDIAAVNGIPIAGHQGKGSITDLTIQRLLTLQGAMKPHQIISLMTFDGADNTLSMADHADHIHIGFHALYGTNAKAAREVDAILKPDQWIKLIDRLGEIDNPSVRTAPSRFSVRTKRASDAHKGE